MVGFDFYSPQGLEGMPPLDHRWCPIRAFLIRQQPIPLFLIRQPVTTPLPSVSNSHTNIPPQPHACWFSNAVPAKPLPIIYERLKAFQMLLFPKRRI